MKKELLEHLINDLDRKIEVCKSGIESARNAQKSDTKSSAGDKYETGRAMMQQEIERNSGQLSKLEGMKRELLKINPQSVQDNVKTGAMVKTTTGLYFFAIGIGPVKFQDQTIFVISFSSPIGKHFEGKKVGEEVVFNGMTQKILSLN
jgi:transcription elongation GreA/GreB family factor